MFLRFIHLFPILLSCVAPWWMNGNIVHAREASCLVVLGDSYADTNNHDKLQPIVNIPSRPPYGRTWPGHPAGRFSDGKVLTDFIASFLNIRSPVTYRAYRERVGRHERIREGMNFAYGGSGMFPTFGPQYTTIPEQIDQLNETGLSHKFSRKCCLVLFVYSGNDYGFQATVDQVENAILEALLRLHNLGFQRFAITTVPPLGCLPTITGPSYETCNETLNALASLHNSRLRDAIASLKEDTQQIVILQQYDTFLLALKTFSQRQRNPLEPCCKGIGLSATCGTTDSTGRTLYTVCPNTRNAFFWDIAHPTQAGWRYVTQFYRAAILSHFRC